MVRYLFYTIGDLTYQSPLVLAPKEEYTTIRQNVGNYSPNTALHPKNLPPSIKSLFEREVNFLHSSDIQHIAYPHARTHTHKITL